MQPWEAALAPVDGSTPMHMEEQQMDWMEMGVGWGEFDQTLHAHINMNKNIEKE